MPGLSDAYDEDISSASSQSTSLGSTPEETEAPFAIGEPASISSTPEKTDPLDTSETTAVFSSPEKTETVETVSLDTSNVNGDREKTEPLASESLETFNVNSTPKKTEGQATEEKDLKKQPTEIESKQIPSAEVTGVQTNSDNTTCDDSCKSTVVGGQQTDRIDVLLQHTSDGEHKTDHSDILLPENLNQGNSNVGMECTGNLY